MFKIECFNYVFMHYINGYFKLWAKENSDSLTLLCFGYLIK